MMQPKKPQRRRRMSSMGFKSGRKAATGGIDLGNIVELHQKMREAILLDSRTSANNFKTSNEFTANDFHKMMVIMGKPAQHRTTEDYYHIDRYCCEIDIFEPLSLRIRLRYYKVSRVIELRQDQVLFSIGDEADAVYAVLSGSVNVIVNMSEFSTHKIDATKLVTHGFEEKKNGKLTRRISTRYKAKRLGPLSSFGAAGIFNVGAIRTATIEAAERTSLLRIEQDEYIELHRMLEGFESSYKTNFLHTIPAFEHWDKDDVACFADRVEKIRLSECGVLHREGDKIAKAYVVKSGECRILKRYQDLGSNLEDQVIEIASLRAGQFVGDYELLRGFRRAQYTVVAQPCGCELLSITRHDFNYLLMRNPRTVDILKLQIDSIYTNLDLSSVRSQLDESKRWNEYKSKIVKECAPRAKPITDDLPTVVSKRKVAAPKSARLQHIVSPIQTKKPQHWLTWAKEKTKGIELTETEKQDFEEEIETQLHWNRSAGLLADARARRDGNISEFNDRSTFTNLLDDGS